ncbi:MAG: AraC family transcriptional regulator [Sedimentisphaerales bacterium]|nr:AraC family transcriptional regulator [Sedimentisphaerales bacterium]
MNYFNDLTFISADIIPHCPVVMDACFPNIYSLEYIAAGRMAFGVDHGPQTILDRPTAHWHHPKHSYQYGAADSKGWHHYYVTFQGPRARRFLEQGIMPLSKTGYLPVAQPLAFSEVFEQLVRIVQRHDPHHRSRAVVLLEQLLCLLSESARDAKTDSPHAVAIKRLAKRMCNHPYQQYYPDHCAAKLHVSISHFRRLFKAHTVHAFHDFVLLCKMRKAAAELRHLNRPIKNIARRAGYPDPAQFSKLFKAKIGLSPLQYRMTLPQ